MECKQILITKNNLIEHCGISKNSDDMKVNVSIIQAENQLQAILCQDYYDYLITHNEAGDLAGKHLILLNNYIEIYLSWAAYEKYILLGSQDSTISGFREQTSDNSQPVTESRLNAIRKNAEEQVLFYKNRMLQYLANNIDDFTLYKESDCYLCKSAKMTFKFTGA